jgi:formylglycine-generating enzyme required for sulfatase activity
MSIVHITWFATFVGVMSGCKPATRATPTPAPAAQPPALQEAAASAPPAAPSEVAKVAPEPPAPEPPPPPEGMVYVPGGTVYIGRPQSVSKSATPPQRAQVSPFFIDRTEVTVAAYLKCAKARDCKLPPYQPGCNSTRKKPRLEHPMNCINKLDAERYCTTQGKRLPTTAEWQAAAGGTDGRSYPWGNEAAGEQLCWQARTDGLEETCPVGSFPQGASPFGALDMAGNVEEWTSTGNPDCEMNCFFIRGGSYRVDDMELGSPETLQIRVDESTASGEISWGPTVGVRCAKDL